MFAGKNLNETALVTCLPGGTWDRCDTGLAQHLTTAYTAYTR